VVCWRRNVKDCCGARVSDVNVILGLPILRLSVDHGTAFDIAGMGIANAGSLMDAAKQAIQMLEGLRREPLPKPQPCDELAEEQST
jgi:hypothetical protein